MSELLLDRAGRRRSPATMPGFYAGRPPRNKGLRYPADPPKVEEIIAVMRAAGDDALRPPAARADRDPVAGRAAHPGSARARRGRPRSRAAARYSSAAARAAGAARSAWTPGAGRSCGPGSSCALELPVGSAVLRHQRPDARPALVKRRRPSATCAGLPCRRGSGGASPLTSSGTPTPSSSRARACR